MRVTAKLNYLHQSPRKVRAVVNAVKKMDPALAMNHLRFIPNRASRPLAKLLKSALANAENNFSLDAGGLKIAEFKVDGGPVFKRFRPASRGRVAPLKRKTSHVTLVLEGQRLRNEKAETRRTAAAEIKPVPESRPKEVKRGFGSKSLPQQKRPGFVKRMFQRKSV